MLLRVIKLCIFYLKKIFFGLPGFHLSLLSNQAASTVSVPSWRNVILQGWHSVGCPSNCLWLVSLLMSFIWSAWSVFA